MYKDTYTKEERSEYNRKYRAANKEKIAAYLALYRIEHKDRGRACSKTYRLENLERLLDASRQKYARSKEKVAAYGGKYRKENPAARRQIASNRRANKINATPKWFSEFDRFVLVEAFRLAKLRGAATGGKWHVDHMVPLVNETVCGLHCATNIQVVTAVENLRKHNKRWPDMPTKQPSTLRNAGIS